MVLLYYFTYLDDARSNTNQVCIARFCKNRDCLWGTKSEQYRNRTTYENALRESVQEVNIPEPDVRDLQLKIKRVHTRCAAELAKVIYVKSDHSVMQACTTLCVDIVLFQTSIFICTWLLFFHELQC